MPQVVAQLDNDEIRPQLVDELCSVHWGHRKSAFYVRKTIENNWLRAVLLNWLDTDLYERQGKAITNFNKQLSVAQGDLANELTKDPYNFEFLIMTEGYNEKELKDALTDSIVKFLLEMGNGFAFVGREYKLGVGKTEQENPMIGLIICKEKNKVLAQYVVESRNQSRGRRIGRIDYGKRKRSVS